MANSPTAAVSMRRTVRRVGRSIQRSRASPSRVSTRCAVEGWTPSRYPIRAGPPQRRMTRTLTMRRSVRVGVWWGFGAVGSCDRSCRPVRIRDSGWPSAGLQWRRFETGQQPVVAAIPPRQHNEPGADGQFLTTGITVGHEDLQVRGGAFLDSSHSTRRSSSCHDATPYLTSVVSTPRAANAYTEFAEPRMLWRAADLSGRSMHCDRNGVYC